MIISFGDARTERLYDGERVKGFPPELFKVVRRKLDMLNRSQPAHLSGEPSGSIARRLTRVLQHSYK